MPNENFRWIRGQDALTSWRKDSGYRSDFCSNCGSPVPNPLRRWPAHWVPAGLLDDPADLEVVVDFHMSSKASWDKIVPTGMQFPELPSAEEFFKLMHSA